MMEPKTMLPHPKNSDTNESNKDQQKQQLQLQPTPPRSKGKSKKKKKKQTKQQLQLQPSSVDKEPQNIHKQQLLLQPMVYTNDTSKNQPQKTKSYLNAVIGDLKEIHIETHKTNTQKKPKTPQPQVPSSNISESNLEKGLDECNVFVKYLPQDLDDKGLYDLFSKFGNITSCKVMIQRETGKSLGFGFVRFSNAEEAKSAISAMNGFAIKNKKLLCKLSNATHIPQSQPSNNLYIRPLPPSYDEEQLKALFKQYGKIIDVKVMTDRQTGESKQSGFVRFEKIEDAQKALSSMNGIKLEENGIPLTVKYAESDLEKALRKQRRLEMKMPKMMEMPMAPENIPYPYTTGMEYYYQMPYYYSQDYVNLYYSGYPPNIPYPYYPGPSDSSANLFVFHLPASIDDHGLYQLFRPFGPIESVKVITDKTTGESKGYGFVKYFQLSDAIQAISRMNGFQIGKKHLKVSFKTNTSIKTPKKESSKESKESK